MSISSPRIAYVTAGAAEMYCGSCLRDNALAAALQREGVNILLIPTYTSIRTDEEDVSIDRVFFWRDQRLSTAGESFLSPPPQNGRLGSRSAKAYPLGVGVGTAHRRAEAGRADVVDAARHGWASEKGNRQARRLARSIVSTGPYQPG